MRPRRRHSPSGRDAAIRAVAVALAVALAWGTAAAAAAAATPPTTMTASPAATASASRSRPAAALAAFRFDFHRPPSSSPPSPRPAIGRWRPFGGHRGPALRRRGRGWDAPLSPPGRGRRGQLVSPSVVPVGGLGEDEDGVAAVAARRGGPGGQGAPLHWVDTLSVPPPNDDGAGAGEGAGADDPPRRRELEGTRRFSLLSWNTLAQSLFEGSRDTFYDHLEEDSAFPWADRLPRILDVVAGADADVVCLQEAEFESFNSDVMPALRRLGYDGMVQGDAACERGRRGRGKSPRFHVVATLWKRDRLRPVEEVGGGGRNDNKGLGRAHMARTRTLTTVLRHLDGSGDDAGDDDGPSPPGSKHDGRTLAVINCHLEGNPLKAPSRIHQLHHSLRDLARHHPTSLHGLVVCGDFNCELRGSACSVYLRRGSCDAASRRAISGVLGDGALAVPDSVLARDESIFLAKSKNPIYEWGNPVPLEGVEDVPPHPYRFCSLKSAYPPGLGADDASEHFTYCCRPHRPVAGLDQIWFSAGGGGGGCIDRGGGGGDDAASSSNLGVVALRRMFASDDDRLAVLASGLPTRDRPSDHLPIGCVFEWAAVAAAAGAAGGRVEPLAIADVDPKKKKKKRGRREVSTTPDSTLPSSSSSSAASVSVSVERLAEEASRLFDTCPFDSDGERTEFLFASSEVPGFLTGERRSRPTDDQLAQLKERTRRRRDLLGSVSPDVRGVLLRILDLQREAGGSELLSRQRGEEAEKEEVVLSEV